MTEIIVDLNRTLRGWFEYFKHSYRPTFRMEDGFARRRSTQTARVSLTGIVDRLTQ
jgi:hypothetical protein